MRLLILVLTALFPLALLGQAPGNDACARAQTIEPGQTITGITNMTATKGFPFSRPDTFPTTCIQTLENDLWYTFTAEPGIPVYQVTISARYCNTPSGLQALLIRTDDCNNQHYQYVACANKVNTDTIQLLLENPEMGGRYLIYVDGYNGTICDFDLTLTGKGKPSADDLRLLRYDYQLDLGSTGQLPGLQTDFANNQAEIHWQSDPGDEVAFFMVETFPPNFNRDLYARVVGIVDPINRVGAGEVPYRFVDRITHFEDGKTYRYRVLKVAPDGTRSVFDEFSIEADLVEDFYLTEVANSKEPGLYQVRYLSHKYKQDFEFWVFDEKGKEIKHLKLPKVTQKFNILNIQMEQEAPGVYLLRCSNGKETFEREFLHEMP